MNVFEDKLNKLKEDYETLIKSPLLKWEGVKELKVIGVYLVYFENEVIYVGSTNNFNVRFGIDLKHISTHTLYKKRFREYLQNEELFDKIKKIRKTNVEIIKENLTKEEFQKLYLFSEIG